MGKIINIQAAKTHLSRLVEEAAAGEEIIIAKAGKPMVKVIPYKPAKKPRTPGIFAGQGWESPDCWEPDEKLIKSFYESSIFPDEMPSPQSDKVAEK
jgi:prevent-host-death family protein